jgi:membrane dipeptidase
MRSTSARSADVTTFHRLGQRLAQLTYNFQTRIGAGFLENRDGGLTVFGHQLVTEMQRVGMTVDLSHCADRTTLDGIAAATKPVVFTHGAARGLMPDYARCKSDDALKALARNGGVMGIAFIRFMIRPAAPVTVEHVVDHIDYVIKLVGADHVGIGSDLDMAGLGTPIPKGNVPLSVTSQPNFERYGAYYAQDGGVHVDGMAHPKRLFDLVEAMGRRRYSDETIRLVLGGNFIRAVGRAGRSGRAQCNAAARSYRFEPRLKEAQQLRLVRKAQPAHGISGVVHLLDTLRDDIHMRLRVHTARNGQPNQFQRRVAIVSSFGVTARADRAAFHRAHT